MFWIRILALLMVSCIIWCVLRPKHAIRIIAGPGGVRKCDGISEIQYSKVVDFFRENLTLDSEVTVLADRDARGLLRIQVRGTRDLGVKQQIRNYLKLTL